MTPETVLHWLSAYGYLALFFLLAGGIVGIPLPDELLLASAGYLVYEGNLQGFATIMAAFTGSICGITITYSLGRTAGNYLIRKWGPAVRISEERLNRAGAMLERRGGSALFCSYFIPGLRQASPFAAGVTGIRFPVFAVCAYPAGLVWSAGFVMAGYYAGEQWLCIAQAMRQTLFYSFSILVLLFVLIYFARRKSGNE